MALRANHYEAAFEAFLRTRQVPYMAVDEKRRSLMGAHSLKSFDFIVSSPGGATWLVDVKGRRFPSGRQSRYWTNWSTRDDLESLARWEQVFGQPFRGLFVFAYQVLGDRAPLAAEELFRFRDGLYGFVAIGLRDYARQARLISPRWNTLAMSTRAFRARAAGVQAFLA